MQSADCDAARAEGVTSLVVVRPRVRSAPAFDVSLGSEAVELAVSCGQDLDPWQCEALEDAMGLQADGRWAAFEFGLNVPRQNGKGGVAEPRVLHEVEHPRRLVLWSSQQQDTSTEALYRLVNLIEDSERLSPLLAKVTYANGKEGIWFTNGSRIRFMTRSKSRARGFSGDLIIFDEAMFLAEYSVGAMLPTLSARANPQVWYMGSAVDQQIHEHGVVWTRVRERGLKGEPRLAYTEFSVAAETPEHLTPEDRADQNNWAQANPALDLRISRDYVESELQALDSRSFAVERLGVGDYPRTDFSSLSPISPEVWQGLVDEDSELQDPICFGYDLSPTRKGAIAAAGRNQNGDWHVEIIRHRQGAGWIVDELAALVLSHEPKMVRRDGYGPVASLGMREEEAGLDIDTTTADQHGQACGKLVDAVAEGTLRHLGSSELADAIRGAATRPLGDAWAWSRKNSTVDISPLVAATLALSAAMDVPAGEVRIW